MIIKRKIEKEVLTLAKEFPIVAILGPRQSGKTTISKYIFKEYKYVSLEDPDMRSFALDDPRGFLSKFNKKVIIDEIQRAPELFSYLQTHTDKLNDTGIFIITGSHNYLLMEKISQSLAGRVGLVTLLPFSINELAGYKKKYEPEELIYKGFYPRIYDKNIRPKSFYKSYLSTYIEKDVRQIRNVANYDIFLKFVKIMAGRTGQVLNTVTVSDECGISHNTVKSWISILETSYIIFKLQPYYQNYKKRLIKNPKLYFYDTGLVCFLLGIKSSESLYLHYLRGSIFETFVISEFIKNDLNQGGSRNFYFWRDSHKKEIDLLIEDAGKIKALEIKSGRTFKNDYLKGLKYWQNLSQNSAKDSYLIYAGDRSLQKDMVNIVPWKNMNNI